MWCRKAANKRVPLACWKLAIRHPWLEECINLLEYASNKESPPATKTLVELYLSELPMKDFNKAYYLSSKTDRLSLGSLCSMADVLATGQFDRRETHHHHRWWARLQFKLISGKPIHIKERSIVTPCIPFADQVSMILLISKFRDRSNFGFTKFLVKNVGLSIIKQLAHVWVF